MALLSGMYAGTRFEPLIAEGFDLRKTVAEQAEMMAQGGMAGEMQAANRNALTAKGFELEARRMAGLMKDKFNIGFIDVGGWDTHVNQGNAQGQLANLLTSLGQGLAGFADQMGPAWNQTVVVRAVGVRPHVPRERHARHRSRPRQRALGARRRACTAAVSSASRSAITPQHAQSESRLSGAHRISRHARRPVQADVFARQRPDRARVSERGGARLRVGVMRFDASSGALPRSRCRCGSASSSGLPLSLVQPSAHHVPQ